MEQSNWIPARQGWKEFCEANPGLALSGNANSFTWFQRQHGPAMIEAGVMRRAHSRALLINTEAFGPVAFEHLTGGSK